MPVKTTVKGFGAVGDGTTDDTKAFQDAIAKTRDGAMEIPPGRYKITGILEINKPNLVLRGAGPDSGARTTFWNIRAERKDFPGRIPALADGNPKFPHINIVGVDQWTTARTADRQWIERWPGEMTEPANLYQAQLARRLARQRAAER